MDDAPNKRGRLHSVLTVTVDINNRFLLAWGTPTNPPTDSIDEATNVPDGDSASATRGRNEGIVFRGVTEAREVRGLLFCQYGKSSGSSVTQDPDTFRAMQGANIVAVLPPMNFVRSRTGGRIAVREDGLEIPILSILGESLGIPDPTWGTTQCWAETPKNVVSLAEKPIGGTREYFQRYYEHSADKRKKALEARKKAKAAPVVMGVEDVLAALRGGGPQG